MTSFDDIDSNPSWISSLKAYQAEPILKMESEGSDLEEIALRLLSKTGSENTAPFGTGDAPKNYYEALKAEFKEFMCGGDRYETLRKEIAKQWDKGKLHVMMTISAAIATYLGLGPAIVLPIVAILLTVVAKMGRNAWCSANGAAA
ncbi:hypothetical protein NKH89_35240 [Mesorhizobium sp. M0923]|uniref:hypothetical protein n=1 Tax=Mesorhizobium sp. M0923 TaxID=2957028 RepID=UPI00333B3E5A